MTTPGPSTSWKRKKNSPRHVAEALVAVVLVARLAGVAEAAAGAREGPDRAAAWEAEPAHRDRGVPVPLAARRALAVVPREAVPLGVLVVLAAARAAAVWAAPAAGRALADR